MCVYTYTSVDREEKKSKQEWCKLLTARNQGHYVDDRFDKVDSGGCNCMQEGAVRPEATARNAMAQTSQETTSSAIAGNAMQTSQETMSSVMSYNRAITTTRSYSTPANTWVSANAVLLLVQRRRSRTNIQTTLGELYSYCCFCTAKPRSVSVLRNNGN